jgi:hypothetical protein
MTRTVPTAPLDDERTWRRLLAAVHPDAGGSEELFVFLTAVKETVLSGGLREPAATPEDASRARRESRRAEGGGEAPARVPYPAYMPPEEAVGRVLRLADTLPYPLSWAVGLLRTYTPTGSRSDRVGASYRSLAKAAHLAGCDKPGRVALYRFAEQVPFSQGMAQHIIWRLGER